MKAQGPSISFRFGDASAASEAALAHVVRNQVEAAHRRTASWSGVG